MSIYQELVVEILYFDNTDIVTTSSGFNDNVAGAPDAWGDGWKEKED